MIAESEMGLRGGRRPEAFSVRVPEDRGLLPVEFCAVALRATYDGVMNLVEAGEIRWAFDISTRGARRSLVRVHRESFLWLLAGRRSNERSALPYAAASDVARSILPSARATVTSTELMAWLFCSHQHITRLFRQGAIEQVGRPSARYGINAIRHAAVPSVARFLARRVIK